MSDAQRFLAALFDGVEEHIEYRALPSKRQLFAAPNDAARTA